MFLYISHRSILTETFFESLRKKRYWLLVLPYVINEWDVTKTKVKSHEPLTSIRKKDGIYGVSYMWQERIIVPLVSVIKGFHKTCKDKVIRGKEGGVKEGKKNEVQGRDKRYRSFYP